MCGVKTITALHDKLLENCQARLWLLAVLNAIYKTILRPGEMRSRMELKGGGGELLVVRGREGVVVVGGVLGGRTGLTHDIIKTMPRLLLLCGV